MSRTSSQQRLIYDQEQFSSESPTDWRQQKSISRNDSQQQMRQPGPFIAATIDESSVMDVRKPSVSFKNDEYEQQSQNFQPMAQQGDSVYDSGQQLYQEPVINQPYQQQPDYSYGTNQQYGNYEQSQQNMGAVQPISEYEQPEQVAPGNYNTNQYEQFSESRRQSPEKEIYQQPVEQEYQPYYEPETPKRRTPPKRDSPSRQQSTEDIKSVQQRQQSRDQLYAREKTESPEETSRSSTVQQRQQSRENIQDAKSPSPTSTISPTPTKGASKSMAPPSPTRNRGKPAPKGGPEQKDGRNSVGEAARSVRKPDAVQKQPAKTATSIRSKK